MNRKLVLGLVAIAVIGAAGTAAAASMMSAPQQAAPIHSAFASHVADSIVPQEEQQPYMPPPSRNHGGCGSHWWG